MGALEVAFALLMGFSLAATCGLRAFLPLFIISLAAKAGMITLASGFDWMASYPALICFGSATMLEILGDKIPAMDHVLDAAGAFVRPVAGAVAASSLVRGMDPLLALALGIIMGAAVAGIVQALKGTLRILSTAATGGIANPVLSAAEDGTTAVAGILGLIVPYVTGVLILLGLLVGGRTLFGRLKRSKPGASGTGEP